MESHGRSRSHRHFRNSGRYGVTVSEVDGGRRCRGAVGAPEKTVEEGGKVGPQGREEDCPRESLGTEKG